MPLKSQIRKLLYSGEPENTFLALEIAQGQGWMDQMRTEFLLAYIFRKSKGAHIEALKLVLGPAAAHFENRMGRDRHVGELDMLLWMSAQPGLELEAIHDFGAGFNPPNGKHGWFLERANPDELRNWLGIFGKGRQSLAFSKHNLAAFPRALEEFSETAHLNLANNAIQRLPSWLPKMHSLRQLDLSKNPIPVLGPQISELYFLRDLALNFSGIRDIKGLAKAPSVERLGLHGCLQLVEDQLRYLPQGIADLDLGGMHHLGPGFFAHLPDNLVSLQWGSGAVIEKGEFGKLPPGIRHLKLALNNVSPEAYCDLPPKLTSLDVHCKGWGTADLPVFPRELRTLVLRDFSFKPGQRLGFPVGLATLELSFDQFEDPKGKFFKSLPDSIKLLKMRNFEFNFLNHSNILLPNLADVHFSRMFGSDPQALLSFLRQLPALTKLHLPKEFATIARNSFPGLTVIDAGR